MLRVSTLIYNKSKLGERITCVEGKTMRLIDCFIEIITYTSIFLKTAVDDRAEASEMAHEYAVLFNRAEDAMKKGKFSSEAWDNARFAVCTWVDEMILCSSWEGRSEWLNNQLQRIYYKSTNGGEEFFERLNQLEPGVRDVREVYAYCLALGFKGRYFRREDEPILGNIQDKNLKCIREERLFDAKNDDAATLFPGAYKTLQEISGSGHRRAGALSAFTVIFLIWPPALFVILFIVYNDILKRIVADFFG